jgi:hypothetical protein
VLASACGGQSFTGGDGGDAGSSSGSTGGTTGNHAGTSSTAGKGHAGTATGGSSTAGTGAGGGSAGTSVGGVGGGSGSPECSLPPSSGNCDAYIPSWYHDSATGICRPFVYGGCGGNENRYASLQACQKSCPSNSPNYDVCKVPSDCVVAGTGCCGICDSANITLNDLIAYNRQYAGFLQCGLALDVAAGGSASSGAAAPIACAPCPLPPAGTGTLQYFVPDCVAGQCVVEDLRTSPVTACKTSSECKLRHGTGCCESCSGGNVVSVRNDGSFEKLVCGDGPVGCLACVPEPISGAAPYCLDGRCSVAIAATGG